MEARRIYLMTFLLLMMVVSCGQDIPPAEWQIKTAVLAAPEEFRDQAKVYGYDASGKLVVLREGNNAYVCMADDPNKEGFSSAAYHMELEPFMARGRELRAQGKESKEIFDIREEEVKSGKLKMPDKTTLCVFSGTVNDQGEVENPYVRYVFYMPYATGSSTGLPTNPMPPGHAWLMDAGTHRAHIMITPPKEEN
ncbi:hypothetical protein WIW50_13040 [Flavobacteriaceae bacterium 3-367]|uniref:hypothetical protein n=1 Tax=Eudoraea algarum TaxID=3417568 RepID=UPI00327797E0